MKKLIFSFLGLIITFSGVSQLQLDSTYIYKLNGTKEWFYIQKDVYCFKTDSASAFTGSVNTCVSNLDFWSNSEARFNEICFDSSSTMGQRLTQVQQIQSDPEYRISSYALSKEQNLSSSDDAHYKTDDKLLITFNDPNIDENSLTEFMKKYSLELVHEPYSGLDNLVSWTYIFRIVPKEGFELNSIELSQRINENEPTLVKLSEPNMYSTKPLDCTPTSEVGQSVGGTVGTWHIRNTGDPIWSGFNGQADADADICECWGEGYTGTGIKVAVIDFGGIEFTHDDFENTNINEVFRADNQQVYTSDTYIDPGDGHAMMVSGVISATPNNSSSGLRYAVGAAYGAELRPYIVNEAAGNAQIIIAIQRAALDQVDVVNMSFTTGAGSGNLENEIDNIINTGRPDPNAPGGNWGTICVAGAGNADQQASNFPANMQYVIGVGWSNPDDYRCSANAPGPGGGWSINSGEGSTYGPPEYEYDVVAPGELIMTTDISGTLGTFPSSYTTNKGSSFSAPIVSSIAAIILDKNPNLTYAQVIGLIRNYAEKVHPGTYDYSMFPGKPGYNNEMFYGRVSCINSIDNTTASIEDQYESIDLTVQRINENQYRIYLPKSNEKQTYQLYDMSGRIIKEEVITHQGEVVIDLSGYSKGMYVFNLTHANKSVAAEKLIK